MIDGSGERDGQGRGAIRAWSAMLNTQEIADIQAWLKTLE